MKSVIESPWNVGEKLYCSAAATMSLLSFDGAKDSALRTVKNALVNGEGALVFPIIQLRVVGVRMYTVKDVDNGGIEVVPVVSATEAVYKVMRNNNLHAIVLLTEDMSEVVKVEWPESKPFHEAFGPLDPDTFRQVMYVAALNVDGHYKLIEVLDDQDW